MIDIREVKPFTPKKVAEVDDFAFNFRTMGPSILVQAITNVEVSVSVAAGTDPNPNAIKIGGHVIDPLNPFRILQKIGGGVLGVCYRLTVTITTDLGNVYVLEGLLTVV